MAVHVNADPADPRTDDISGDVINDGKVAVDWGLHVVDVNVSIGDMIANVAAQSAAYSPRH